MTLLEIVKQFCEKKKLRGRVLCGFSGGIDSTALVMLLHEAGLDVTAVHFQHGLRGEEAEADAVWCEEYCRIHGIRFELIRLNVPLNSRAGESVEEAARRLRIESWQRLSGGTVPVFLAHHADDALEELFLRLGRGCNSTGLTSLRDDRVVCGVRFLRPMLHVRKAELREWLVTHGVTDWRTDSTNADCDYRRNAVRNRLLPLVREIFGSDAGFQQALGALALDADNLEQQALEALPTLNAPQGWQALHPAVLPRAFRLWRRAQDGIDEAPSRGFTMRLREELHRFDGHHPSVMRLAPGTFLRLDKDGLRIVKSDVQQEDFSYSWNWRTQPVLCVPEANVRLEAMVSMDGITRIDPMRANGTEGAEWFSLEAVPEVLTVRSWRAGDRMIPFGGHSQKKVQDIFTESRVHREDRGRVPVMLAGETIVWLAGVRRGEFGRVKDGDGAVCLRLSRQS